MLHANVRVLREIEPRVENLLDRHMRMTREWFPHEYVPWSRGEDFACVPWHSGQSQLSSTVQAAFEESLLTEDNLPSYHRLFYSVFGAGDGAWINWVHQWTAEEARHSIVLRDYLTVTRGVDPYGLERARMVTMQRGYQANEGYESDRDPLTTLAFTAIQELATRIAHYNTGATAGDPIASKLTDRLAQDENLHMIFYRDAVAAAFEVAPSEMLRALVAEVVKFAMPGANSIPGFSRRALLMADAGIYDPRIHHDSVLRPLLSYWRVFEARPLSAEAELARDRLAGFMQRLDSLATRFAERRNARLQREERVPAHVQTPE